MEIKDFVPALVNENLTLEERENILKEFFRISGLWPNKTNTSRKEAVSLGFRILRHVALKLGKSTEFEYFLLRIIHFPQNEFERRKTKIKKTLHEGRALNKN